MTHAHPSLPNSMHEYISKWPYEELTTSSAHSSFSTTYQSSVCFTCSPQVCFGCVTMWLAHSPRPNHLWSATWSPQVGTCLCRYHPMHSNTQSTRGIQRWEWLQRMAAGKDCGEVRRMKARSMAAPPSRRPSCSCSGRTPSSPGHAVRRGPKESDGLALLGPNC